MLAGLRKDYLSTDPLTRNSFYANMSSDSDAGYSSSASSSSSSSDDERVVRDLLHRRVARARRLRPRYCVVQSYVKWGMHVVLCMHCYVSRFVGVRNVHFIQTHFTVAGLHDAMRGHSRCRLCRERLFTVFHRQSCVICNRI